MRGHAAVALALAFTSLAVAGCIGPAEAPEPTAPAATGGATSRVVVAIIDTGINLYHEEFRRLGGSPPAYLPADATPVTLDLSGADWDAVHEANEAALMALEPERLYTFPGTKVVGAISFVDKPDDWPLVLDRPGSYTHGTMTASRAVGNTIAIGGAEAEIDLVIVQGFSARSVTWAAEQDWIDVISISAGISRGSSVPGAPNLLDDGGIEAYEAASHAKPFFASSGNGVANAGLLGFPSWMRGSSGVPDAISVGANDNDRTSHWHNLDPYVSADGCDNPAAAADSLDEVGDTGGGTSSAAPFSAGGGARLLLEARRVLGDTHVGPRVDETLPVGEGWDSLAESDNFVVLARAAGGIMLPPKGPLADGVFTLREFKDVLYHTALPAPTDDESDGAACVGIAGAYVPGDALPEDRRFTFQGYGEINGDSVAHAVAVVKGVDDAPERPSADAAYAEAHARKVRFVREGLTSA